ncbi:tRNA pseudouridine synthase B [Bacillus oleivorans]|uniref:tRNA pseudouridine synthase B n=1 Tax=Bacillus oleivorans TaxID=1448271 RepID=A0A285D1Q8_9BACI|nr:tRNA pseudouridine(55) synthase TruB [Bacillus oleivorans]SNX73767.1 tRNA pseudouridine synthase B [Bacillus oleivorans]
MDGVLPLYKPKGVTSHDCVNRLRKIFQTKKVGHTGTLDPDVTGVLPICIGGATRISEYLLNSPKGYEGEVTLGMATTTEDASGEVVQETNISSITREEIEKAMNQLTGTFIQVPPMYSAVKVNGKKLYEYAREGKEVERPKREITVFKWTLESDQEVFEGPYPSFRFSVQCSKGTYVRTLAVMIGEVLGVPAFMSDLKRTKSSIFTLADCKTFEELEAAKERNELAALLVPISVALSDLPKFVIHDTLASKVQNGMVLEKELLSFYKGEESFLFVDESGKALAIYRVHPNKSNLLKPEKVFHF